MSHAADGDGTTTGPVPVRTSDPSSSTASTVPTEPTGSSEGARVDATPADDDATTVTVWRSMTRHGTVTVFVEVEHTCRHLVDYESDEFEALLDGLPTGTTLPIEMERVAGRGDGWRVTGIP